MSRPLTYNDAFVASVLELARCLICVVDRDGQVVLFNGACEEASGYSAAEVIGRDLAAVCIPPEEREGFAEVLRRAFVEGKPNRAEGYWRRRDGTLRRLDFANRPLLDENGNPEYLIAAGLDVTERRAQEDELHELHRELERRFAELRESRTRILEAADTARRRLERDLHDGAQQRFVTTALRLRQLDRELERDRSEHLDAVRVILVELDEGLAELRELARGLHPAVLSDFGLEAALDGLAARSPVPVELDSALGERLPGPLEIPLYFTVAEALTNVAKYAGATEIRVRLFHEESSVVAEVSDDGCGGADPSAGSGLLGISDRVGAVDGTLTVTSPPGQGTTVRVEIPLAR